MCGFPSEPDNLEVGLTWCILQDGGKGAAPVVWDQGGTRAEGEAVLLNFSPLQCFSPGPGLRGRGSEAPLIDPSVTHTGQPAPVLGKVLLPPRSLFLL